MNDSLFMRRFKGLSDLPCDWKCLVDRNRSLRDAVGKRIAFDQLHDQRLHVGAVFEARAIAILATAPQIFIRFRELMSARGNALLKLSKPVEDDLDMLCAASVALDLHGPERSDNPAIRREVVIAPAFLVRVAREGAWNLERRGGRKGAGCGVAHSEKTSRSRHWKVLKVTSVR